MRLTAPAWESTTEEACSATQTSYLDLAAISSGEGRAIRKERRKKEKGSQRRGNNREGDWPPKGWALYALLEIWLSKALFAGDVPGVGKGKVTDWMGQMAGREETGKREMEKEEGRGKQ